MATYPVYFITWTTYGTWLHGDERGSVVDVGSDSLLVGINPSRRARTSSGLAEDPFVMDAASREVVDGAIRRHAAKREWVIHALNARTNHVHVVVGAAGTRPEVVAGQFKAWGTRDLRAAGLIEGWERVWTAKASTRWINEETSLRKAANYVMRFQ